MFSTRASLPVDLFLLTLVLVVPAMLVAVALVRRGRIKTHATIMVTSFVFFLGALIAFEIDVQLAGHDFVLARLPLTIHLCLAIPALLLWVFQIATFRTARTAPARHRRRGRLLMGLLVATVATGVWLYGATFA